MKIKLLLGVLIGCLVIGFAGTAAARRLSIENRLQTGVFIQELYIAPIERSDWGPNMLPVPLYSNYDANVYLDYRTRDAQFKVRIVADGARDLAFNNIVLHDIGRLKFWFGVDKGVETYQLTQYPDH